MFRNTEQYKATQEEIERIRNIPLGTLFKTTELNKFHVVTIIAGNAQLEAFNHIFYDEDDDPWTIDFVLDRCVFYTKEEYPEYYL